MRSHIYAIFISLICTLPVIATFGQATNDTTSHPETSRLEVASGYKKKCIHLWPFCKKSIPQKKTTSITYEFDKNGVLIKEPPSILMSPSAVCVHIAFDPLLFKTRVDSIAGNILTAIVTWKSRKQRIETQQLADKQDSAADLRKTLRDNILALIQQDTSEPVQDSLLQSYLQQDAHLTSKLIEEIDNSVIIQRIDRLISDLSYLYQALHNKEVPDLLEFSPCGKDKEPAEPAHCYKFTPTPAMIINHLIESFTLEMDCGAKNCKTDIALCLQPNCCGGYELFGCCQNLKGDVIINLYKNDASKNLFIDWYNQHILEFKDKQLGLFDSVISADPIYSQMLKMNQLADSKHWDRSLTALQQLNNNWSKSQTINFLADPKNQLLFPKFYGFMLHFTWYNRNGLLMMNPLGFTTPTLFQRSAPKAKAQDKIDTIFLNRIDTFLSKQTIDPTTDPQKLASLFNILYKRDSMLNRMDSTQTAGTKSAQASALKSDTTNSLALHAFELTGIFDNRVVTPATLKKDSAIHIRNYLFKRPADKRNFKYDYPDNERVVLAVHNVPGLNDIAVTSSLSKFNELPEAVADGLATTDSLSGTASTAANIFSNLAGGEGVSFHHAIVPRPNKTPKQQFEDLAKQMGEDFRRIKWFDSVFKHSQLPPLRLEKIAGDSPQLRTVLNYPDGGNKAPFEFDYKLTIKDTSKSSPGVQIDSSYYRIGKRRLVELSMGIAYSATTNRQTKLDTTNGGVGAISTQNRIQVIVGLKFHLSKMYWGNNHFVLSDGVLKTNSLLERLSVFAGVSLPDPLANFYLGLGVDPIPGINVNAGLQLYRYDKYGITDNQITDQATVYKPGAYISVTLDARLFVNIITTFFK